jgi:pimeloyl-ACP methyl ester carboxylesterase
VKWRFGWFNSEQRERRRKIRLDRKHLEARSRRFLRRYLNADETLKPQFYRVVEEMSKQCQPARLGLPPPELEDAQIAEATSNAAMKIVLERGAKKDVRIPALYMAGDRDLVVKFPGMDQLIVNLKQFVPKLQQTIILPDCGHWTQQEKADEVNSALIAFLKSLDLK